MDERRELRPSRDFFIALGICLIAGAAIFSAPVPDFPILHTILNTGIALGTVTLSLLFWDLGWRTSEPLVRLKAIVFAVVGVLEILHVIAALEPSTASETLNGILWQVRSGSWAPPAYLLPLGLGAALWVTHMHRATNFTFALGAILAAVALFWLFQWLPRYTTPVFLGIIRPTLVLVPLLWIPVGFTYWRRREIDRIAYAMALYAVILALSHTLMLFSDEATSKFAMAAHFGVFGGGLYLLLSLMQMGTADTARRIRAEFDLSALNAALESRVHERTRALEASNSMLRQEMETREVAERKALTQVERLHQLHQITHAVGERQDVASIFQVVVSNLEDHMPVDFACLCNYDRQTLSLTINFVGARSATLANRIGLSKGSVVNVDKECMTNLLIGELVHEPDLAELRFAFPRRLAEGGLRTLVAAPLKVDERAGVLGILLLARTQARSFTSGDCEFLNQLSEHVALAINQAQLHQALQRAYDELRDTQQAIMHQERLRTLGQMASGIAHDINNAISPATLYVDAILERETGLDDRTRNQLEIVRRAIGDVAHTVARMGEFYRQRDAKQLSLQALTVNDVLAQIPDLTRARWSDMAQSRGAVIDVRVEKSLDAPIIMGIDSELREALINLVFNSADALQDGGTIVLRSRISKGDRNGSGRRVYVEVSDDGPGMDDATRARCMEPFFTTKGERGSGLGLAMVYGIARRHGAEIEIDTGIGRGTTVKLIFPASAPPKPEPTLRAEPQYPARGLRILLVDDDPLLLQSLHDALVYEGHAVVCANGGQAGIEAFAAAKQRDQPFPVVITDLGMPRVDGRQVAVAIRQSAPETLILMLTGWGQRLVESDDTPDAVDQVLSKPPNMWQLREALARADGD